MMSASVLAALLSALLLFSPGTARAVAHVLAENGVTLPANVVRILDTLPADPARDTLRRDDEAVCVTASDVDATTEDEPEPISKQWGSTFLAVGTVADFNFLPAQSPERYEYSATALRHSAHSRTSPRAPPV